MSDNSDNNYEEFEEADSTLSDSTQSDSTQQDDDEYEFNESSELSNSRSSSIEILNDSIPSNVGEGDSEVEEQGDEDRNNGCESDSSSSDNFVHCSTKDVRDKVDLISDDDDSVELNTSEAELSSESEVGDVGIAPSVVNSNDAKMDQTVNDNASVEQNSTAKTSAQSAWNAIIPQPKSSSLDPRAFSMFPTTEDLSNSTKEKVKQLVPDPYESSSLCTVSYSSDCYIPQCDYQQAVNNAKDKMEDLTICDNPLTPLATATSVTPVDSNSMDISNPPEVVNFTTTTPPAVNFNPMDISNPPEVVDPRLKALKDLRLLRIAEFSRTKHHRIFSEILSLNRKITALQGFNDMQTLPSSSTTVTEAQPCSSKDQCYKKASLESVINNIYAINASTDHEQKVLNSNVKDKSSENGNLPPAAQQQQPPQPIPQITAENFSTYFNRLPDRMKAAFDGMAQDRKQEHLQKIVEFNFRQRLQQQMKINASFLQQQQQQIASHQQTHAESKPADESVPTKPMSLLTINDPQQQQVQPSTTSKFSVVTGPCFNFTPTAAATPIATTTTPEDNVAVKAAYDEMQEHSKTCEILKEVLSTPGRMPKYLIQHFERRYAETEGSLKAAKEKYENLCKDANVEATYSAASFDAKKAESITFPESPFSVTNFFNELKRCGELAAAKDAFIANPEHDKEMALQLEKQCIAANANLLASKQLYNEWYATNKWTAKNLWGAKNNPFVQHVTNPALAKNYGQTQPFGNTVFNTEAIETAMQLQSLAKSDETTKLQAEIRDLKQSLQDTENSRRTLAEMNETLTAENKWLQKNDENIREMEMALNNAKKDHQKALEEKDAKIVKLQVELAEQHVIIEKKERTLAHQFLQIEGLNRKRERASEEAGGDMDKQVKEEDAKCKQLNATKDMAETLQQETAKIREKYNQLKANKNLSNDDWNKLILQEVEETSKLHAELQRKKDGHSTDPVKAAVEEQLQEKNAEIAKIKAEFEQQTNDFMKRQEETLKEYQQAFDAKDADIAQLLSDLEKFKKSHAVKKTDENLSKKSAASSGTSQQNDCTKCLSSVLSLPVPIEYWDTSEEGFNGEMQALRLEEAQNQTKDGELTEQLKMQSSDEQLHVDLENYQQEVKERHDKFLQIIDKKNTEIVKLIYDSQRKIKELKELKAQHEEVLNQYQSALDAKDADYAAVLSENEDLKKHLAGCATSFGNCPQNLKETIKQKDAEIAVLKADIKQIQKKFSEYATHKHRMSSYHPEEARNNVELLELSNSSSAAVYNPPRIPKTTAFQNDVELLALVTELSAITEELNNIKKVSEYQDKVKAELEKEISDMKEDLSSTIKELSDLQKVYDNQDKVNADLEKEVADLKKEILKLRRNIEAKDARIAYLIAEIEKPGEPIVAGTLLATPKDTQQLHKSSDGTSVVDKHLQSLNKAIAKLATTENGTKNTEQNDVDQQSPNPASAQPATPAPVEQLSSYANSLWESLQEAAAKSNEEFLAEQQQCNKNVHQKYYKMLKKVENEQKQVSDWINSSTKKAAKVQAEVVHYQKKVAMKKITSEDLRKALEQGHALQNSVSNSIKDLSKQQAEYYQNAGIDFAEIRKILKTADANILKQQAGQVKRVNKTELVGGSDVYTLQHGKAEKVETTKPESTLDKLQKKLEQLQTTTPSKPSTNSGSKAPSELASTDANIMKEAQVQCDESNSDKVVTTTSKSDISSTQDAKSNPAKTASTNPDPKLTAELAKAQQQIEYFQKLAADQAEALKKFELAKSLEKQLSEATQKADKALKALRKREAMDSVSRDLVLKRFKEDDDDHSPVV